MDHELQMGITIVIYGLMELCEIAQIIGICGEAHEIKKISIDFGDLI
jgi:hypothetical protein